MGFELAAESGVGDPDHGFSFSGWGAEEFGVRCDSHATEIQSVHPKTLLFVLGELPFITGLYERAREQLDDDENLSIDGVKELLLVARERYRADFKGGFDRLLKHGANFTSAHDDFFPTLTAVAHATLLTGGSDPVITKKPSGAWTHKIYDAMK